MRKRNFTHYVDTIFWNIVYMLPVFVLLIYTWSSGNLVSLSDIFNGLNLNILTDNVVLTNLSSIFGTGGIFPIFQNNDILIFLTYFVNMVLLHLVVDFLLFIPRCAHNILDKYGKKE